jgi:hypothetical protein
MTGEECSQPPDGVAEIMLPALSMISKCTVSPRLAPMRPTVGSPTPAAISAGARRSFTTAPKPAIEPGRNSRDAVSPISLRRSEL